MERPPKENRFEFVVIAGKRARLLRRKVEKIVEEESHS